MAEDLEGQAPMLHIDVLSARLFDFWNRMYVLDLGLDDPVELTLLALQSVSSRDSNLVLHRALAYLRWAHYLGGRQCQPGGLELARLVAEPVRFMQRQRIASD
jgi:hypothetical protein